MVDGAAALADENIVCGIAHPEKRSQIGPAEAHLILKITGSSFLCSGPAVRASFEPAIRRANTSMTRAIERITFLEQALQHVGTLPEGL